MTKLTPPKLDCSRKSPPISRHPDAIVVHRVDHLRYHGDIWVLAVDFVSFEEFHMDEDGFQIIEAELEKADQLDTLELRSDEPGVLEIPMVVFDRIAALVAEYRQQAEQWAKENPNP